MQRVPTLALSCLALPCLRACLFISSPIFFLARPGQIILSVWSVRDGHRPKYSYEVYIVWSWKGITDMACLVSPLSQLLVEELAA